MKKKIISVLLAVCLVTAAGCGSRKISTGNKQIENAVYEDDFVSLAKYTGLKEEKEVYKVTQQAVDDAVEEQLEEYAEYQKADRASETGDYVYTDYTASIDGSIVDQEKNYYFILGDEEFGAEFDEKLTGVSKGDQLAFNLHFDTDDANENFAGKTVAFEIRVRRIEVAVLPETTDKFIKENFGYETYEEFKQAVREHVRQTYDAESTDSVQEKLLKQVIDASGIVQYTTEDYEEAAAIVDSFYQEYAEMFNQDIETIYETFEVTDESKETEIMDQLNRLLVVRAIIKNEKMTISDEEYEEGIAFYMEENDYTSSEEFINDYGEEEIKNRLLEDKVLKLLEDSAELTEVEADYEM